MVDARAAAAAAAAWAALLLGWAAAGQAAAPPDISCFDCAWLEELPLDEWSAERNSTREVLPWGQVVEFPPIDYRRLAEELCECVQDSLEGSYGSHQPPNHSVQAQGTQFVLHDEPFYFAGFNAAQALSWAASNSSQLLDNLQSLFANAAELGLRVGRVFATANGIKVRPPFLDEFDRLQPELEPLPWLTLQPAPGVLDEAVLEGLDYLLSLAASHGIKLVLTLADFHAVFGPSPAGIEPYIQWVIGSLNLTGYTVLDFYRDERVKLLYRHNLCHIANRASSLTGVKYKDDPTIFSWDLVNEPRCPACPGATRGAVLSAWADEMSAFLSCVDPNHMIHVGSEGYFTETAPEYIAANPGSWALCSGVDFVELALLPHIHYGAAHMYEEMRFQGWIQAHFDASSAVTGKPFVLEEFNKKWDERRRNQLFRLVQATFRAAWQQNASSPAAGAMFWGATAGDTIDWDGWQVRLDGGRSAPAPSERAEKLKAQMPPEQQQHSVLYQLCQAVVKDIFAPTFAGYSSNTTVSRAGSRHLSLPARALMLMLPGIRGMQYQHRRW
ncbi:hypothetical protein CHLNCDRAFT_136075 [Chlorella variabilis]|uniref:mannan endo-1,4-beta-mannosidase n=1 Tax=Chlorella variabilis TaxID=554065 RepID=E1ZJP6_CHLVA|nr:hypothetical protein CHLNCDRAFT_136075 [Chlorella variabilis]EFN53900.1 hypothetical protein CHLNCDRAFT_136075 [Chlorella variabilis]|eukprot:XP_005846002.1 hypothetical protein CHLNCDRAFT_136075 [Chlorella variabilis]